MSDQYNLRVAPRDPGASFVERARGLIEIHAKARGLFDKGRTPEDIERQRDWCIKTLQAHPSLVVALSRAYEDHLALPGAKGLAADWLTDAVSRAYNNVQYRPSTVAEHVALALIETYEIAKVQAKDLKGFAKSLDANEKRMADAAHVLEVYAEFATSEKALIAIEIAEDLRTLAAPNPDARFRHWFRRVRNTGNLRSFRILNTLALVPPCYKNRYSLASQLLAAAGTIASPALVRSLLLKGRT